MICFIVFSFTLLEEENEEGQCYSTSDQKNRQAGYVEQRQQNITTAKSYPEKFEWGEFHSYT